MIRDELDDGRPAVLTDEQQTYLEGWVRRQADVLGLREWRFRVSKFAAKDGAIASSFIRDHSDQSVIGVCKEFLGNDPDEQRATLAHELLHPHFYRVTRLVEKLVENELGQRTEAVILTAMREQEELTIERMAHAIAQWLEPIAMPKASGLVTEGHGPEVVSA